MEATRFDYGRKNRPPLNEHRDRSLSGGLRFLQAPSHPFRTGSVEGLS